MLFAANYANLETLAPVLDTNPADINKGQLPPDLFRDDPWPGGTTITIEGPKYSAGLSKRYITPIAGLLQAASQFTFSYQIKPGDSAPMFSQVHENDFRASGPSGEVYVGDAQKNNQEGGIWMIGDGKGGWNALSKTGLFTTMGFTTVIYVFRIVWGKSLTWVSLTDGGVSVPIPAGLATVAAANLAWQPGLLGFQNQEGLNALGGCYQRSTRNIGIAMQ